MLKTKEKKAIVKTWKFQILPTGSKEEKAAIWSRIRHFDSKMWRAANSIVEAMKTFDSLGFNLAVLNDEAREQIRRVNTLIDDSYLLDEKDGKKLRKELYVDRDSILEPFREKAKGLLLPVNKKTGKPQTPQTFSARIAKAFSGVPLDTLDQLNQQVCALYRGDKKDVFLGKKVHRQYKPGLPIPVRARDIKDLSIDGFRWIEGMKFDFYHGKGKSKKDFAKIQNRKSTIQKVIDGKYNLKGSKIQLKEGKVYLLASIEVPIEQHDFIEGRVAGVDLGISCPAYIAIPDTYYKEGVGSSDDFFRVRLQMRKRRKSLQGSLRTAKGGRGRKKKLKALERLKEQERNFVKTYNHMISRRIIDFCLKAKCGILGIEDLSNYGKGRNGNVKEGSTKVILSHWSYYELQSMIEYKAKEVGLKVVKVNAGYTSLTCHCCGEIGERPSQKEFLCGNNDCEYGATGTAQLADENAALNIALRAKKGMEAKA